MVQPDVDLYSASYLSRQVVFSKAGLAAGPHTLVVTWTGRRNASAVYHQIGLDAIRVAGTLTQAP